MATKTFLEYTDYELYSSHQYSVEVPTRDVKQLDYKKLFGDLPPSYLGFPTEFKFYDAETDERGREIPGTRHNISKDYIVADIVMTLDDYIKREEPKLEKYKKELTGRFNSFTSTIIDGGGGLMRAFKAAIGKQRPVMDWYIRSVETSLASAKAQGATHIALWDNHETASPKLVGSNVIVLDKQLNQLHPSAAVPQTRPVGPAPL